MTYPPFICVFHRKTAGKERKMLCKALDFVSFLCYNRGGRRKSNAACICGTDGGGEKLVLLAGRGRSSGYYYSNCE